MARIEELEKLRRLSELELAKPGALTSGGFHARNKYTAALIENEAALLAAAREHLQLKSALEFLQRSARRVCLVVDYRAPGEATYQVRPWAAIQVAKQLGWKPESEA